MQKHDLETIAIILANLMCLMKFLQFWKCSNYDYHFMIKELVNEFKAKFECHGESTEKYKTSSFQYKKKLEKLIKMLMTIL